MKRTRLFVVLLGVTSVVFAGMVLVYTSMGETRSGPRNRGGVFDETECVACEPCDNSSPFNFPNFIDKKPDAPPVRSDLSTSADTSNVMNHMVFKKEFIRTELFTYESDTYIFTLITFDFFSMWLNFYKSLEQFGLHKNIVVIVTDEETEKAIFPYAFNYVYLDFALPKGGAWGQETYMRIVQSKFFLLQCIQYLKLYEKMEWIAFFDSDIFFEKDPLPWLKSKFEEKQDLEILWWGGCWVPACNAEFTVNTGGAFFKPNAKIFLLFTQSLFMQKYKYPGCTDQRALNAILRGGDDSIFKDTNFAKPLRFDDRYNTFRIVWDLMDTFMFPVGMVFYDGNYQNQRRKHTIGIHYNFIVGIQTKIDKMKAYNTWLVD